MSRIFLTLVIVQQFAFAYTFFRGWLVGDPQLLSEGPVVGLHMFAGLLTVIFAVFCHAIFLTYFVGTGRWIEETSNAYLLSTKLREENAKLKWGTFPAMVPSLLLLIAVGALGTAADPASQLYSREWGGIASSKIHLMAAATGWFVNLSVSVWEFFAIRRNGQLVQQVLSQVREIRVKKGLEV